MYTLPEETTIVAFSELRTKLKEVVRAMDSSRVVLAKRNRPFAVLIPIERFKKMEEILDLVEDRALGFLAQEREKGIKEKDYLSLDEAEKRVGLR